MIKYVVNMEEIMKKVSDVMNKNLVVISKDTAITEILNLMKDKKIGRIPVVENEKVVGVVTRDDLLVKQEIPPVQPVIAFWEVLITLPSSHSFDEKVKKLAAYSAEQVMTEEFFSCSPDTDLEKIVTEMLEEKHDYVVVLENEKPVGILTKSDLIEKCF